MIGGILMCCACTLSHVPGLVLRYVPFSGKANQRQKRCLLLLYSGALLLNLAAYLAAEFSFGAGVAFYKIDLLVFWIFTALINAWVLRGKAWEHLFTFGLVAIILIMLLSVGVYIQLLLPPMDFYMAISMVMLITLALWGLLYRFLKQLMLNTVTPFIEEYDSKDYRRDLWFVPIAMSLACFTALPLNEDITNLQQLISRLMIGVATLFVCRSTSYDYAQMRERIALHYQLSLQKQYYSALADNAAEIRKMRHDFKHHVAALNALLEQDSLEPLKEYMLELEGSRPMTEVIPYTGNAAADGVLYHYMVLGQAEGIRFEIHCAFSGGVLPDVSLCSLLGNALDNAVTACQTVPKEERFIRVRSRTEGDLLILTIDNSFDGMLERRGELLLSRKREHEPGIGISSMQSICKEHGGTCRFEAKGRVFEASFLLKCQQEK